MRRSEPPQAPRLTLGGRLTLRCESGPFQVETIADSIGARETEHGEPPEDRRLAMFRAQSRDLIRPTAFSLTPDAARAGRLLQRVAHLGEHGADLGADILEGDDDEDRD